MNDQAIRPTGCPPSREATDGQCCEPFNPEPWQDPLAGSGQAREIVWNNKIFVKDRVTSFLHIPLNFGQKVVKNMKLIQAAGAEAEHQLMLTDENSLWGADIYIDVSKEVPGARMATISGTFLTKVFEGPYKNAGMWAREMKEYVKGKGKELEKIYFSYTTCPKCAKAYGKNYVVLFAQIK